MVYTPRVNDYVTFGDKEEYGVVKLVEKTQVTVVDKNGNEQTVAAGLVKPSTFARITIKAMPNIKELAENVAFMSAYNGAIAGRRIMGPENVSFLVAELIHEFLLKGTLASYFDFLAETHLNEDANSFFQMSDFTDPLRKLPFVFALTQLAQKFLYKKPLSHGAFHNILGGYSSMGMSNVADRMFTAEKGKKYAYL